MYGFETPMYNSKDGNIKNEMAIQNLIAVANNPILFEALDENTRVKLVDFIASYTKKNLEEIEKYQQNQQKWGEIYQSGEYAAKRNGR